MEGTQHSTAASPPASCVSGYLRARMSWRLNLCAARVETPGPRAAVGQTGKKPSVYAC